MSSTRPIERLSAALSRLPGVGRRTAERMAIKIARDPSGLLKELAAALEETGKTVCSCSLCGSITSVSEEPCRLCVDDSREKDVLCVVEDPGDIMAIEKSGGFHGRYHSLLGKISPIKGEGPGDIRIASLLERVEKEGVREVILALNTDVESDATASYIAERLENMKVKTTRLAFGLPAGSGIVYSDSVTLARAIRGRTSAL